MTKTTNYTYTLSAEEVREAVADWINKTGEESVDEKEMTFCVNFIRAKDAPSNFDWVTVGVHS